MATRGAASAAGVDLKRSASFYSPAGFLLFCVPNSGYGNLPYMSSRGPNLAITL